MIRQSVFFLQNTASFILQELLGTIILYPELRKTEVCLKTQIQQTFIKIQIENRLFNQ